MRRYLQHKAELSDRMQAEARANEEAERARREALDAYKESRG